MWQPGWKETLGRMDTCICMAELFCCAPVAIRTLLISYAPIWGKKSATKGHVLCDSIHMKCPELENTDR